MEVTLEQVRRGLREARYITTPRVETALFLTLTLEKPLLAEGPAGAGKTELGKVLASMLGAELLRLQCYEGLDEARALFEWNYQKQLLRIQADRGEVMARSSGRSSRKSGEKTSCATSSQWRPSPRSAWIRSSCFW